MHELAKAIRHLAEAFPRAYDLMNLRAQAEMAFWAKWAFFGSLASVVLSAVALIGLFMSLRQTRVAIVDAREIGEAQTRAFVVITNAECSIYNAGTKKNPIDRIRFKIAAKVCGATPAQDVSVDAIKALFRDAPADSSFSSNNEYYGGMAPGDEFDPVALSWPLGDEHDEILMAHEAFELRGVITYRCIVVRGLRKTEFAFRFGEHGKFAGKGRNLLPIPLIEGLQTT